MTVLFMALAMPQAAVGCDTVFWVKQGQYEEYYDAHDVIVLRPGAAAMIRVYYGSGGGTPYTTSAQIGHPWDFNLEGYDRRDTQRVLWWRPQNNQQLSIGKANLDVGQQGQTLLAYRLLDVGRGRGLGHVPAGCRAGTIAIRVEAANRRR